MTMQWTKQELPIIATDNDLTNALALYEQLASKDGTDQQFLYILSLIIADYEAQHYPMAVSSTVDFIDHLLEERQSSWRELQTFLSVESFFSVDYLKTVLQSDNIRVQTFVALSHFFKLPVQAFIVGGYRA